MERVQTVHTSIDVVLWFVSWLLVTCKQMLDEMRYHLGVWSGPN